MDFNLLILNTNIKTWTSSKRNPKTTKNF